jgi:hypothetical protein
MGFPHSIAAGLWGLAGISLASFWLTVALAAAGSVLSAFCVADPVSEPKRDPYVFLGQWFIWLATPLLWGTAAASLAWTPLKIFDLLAVLVLLGLCRRGAQAICNRQWRRQAARLPGFVLPSARSNPSRG